MKPIFCTDITVDKHNQVINGSEFITANASEDIRAELDKKANDLENTIQSSKTPSWMVMVKNIAGFGALVMAMSLFSTAMQAGSIGAIFAGGNLTTTIICLGAVAIWFYLGRVSKEREKSIRNNTDIKARSNELENGIAMLYSSMGVPANAVSADIIMFQYKMKDGQINPVSPLMMPTPYFNFECKVYADGDCLCIADTENVYSFKKCEILGTRFIEQKTSFVSWNKAAGPTDAPYAEYGLTLGKLGTIVCNGYYALDFKHDGEMCEIYFPVYELPVFEGIINSLKNEEALPKEAVSDELALDAPATEECENQTCEPDEACEEKKADTPEADDYIDAEDGTSEDAEDEFNDEDLAETEETDEDESEEESEEITE